MSLFNVISDNEYTELSTLQQKGIHIIKTEKERLEHKKDNIVSQAENAERMILLNQSYQMRQKQYLILIMILVFTVGICALIIFLQERLGMKKTTLEMIKKGAHKKGDVLAIARIAGIMSTKKTSDLIPLCHPIGVEAVNIEFEINNRSNSIKILSSCKTSNKTGIEIEALMAVSISALTIYDMCKSVDKEMHLDAIMLTHKSGGKSGTFNKK